MHTVYKDILLDHYRYPRNQGILSAATCTSAHYNPSCGDAVSMTARIEGSIITDVRFEASGCVICVAAASLLSEQIKGISIANAMKLDTNSIVALLGIPLGPTRLKCALLALSALHEGLRNCTVPT